MLAYVHQVFRQHEHIFLFKMSIFSQSVFGSEFVESFYFNARCLVLLSAILFGQINDSIFAQVKIILTITQREFYDPFDLPYLLKIIFFFF